MLKKISGGLKISNNFHLRYNKMPILIIYKKIAEM